MAREGRKSRRGLAANADAQRAPAAPAELAPAPVRPVSNLEEMLVRATPVTGQEQPQLRAILREGLTALCKAWAHYSLRRAIADVASTSAQDYRHFGFDKAEILQALGQLQDEIGTGAPLVPERSDDGGTGCPLAIVVSKARQRRHSIGV